VTECLFCGSAGGTKEHLLSTAWLERLMPNAGPYNFKHTTTDQGHEREFAYSKKRPEVVTRGVCAACNNGWMNTLDLDAQPMLTTMVAGQKLSIEDLLNKVLIANWITKVAILVDSMQPSEAALASDHASWLFDHRVPPPGWHIWLAAMRQIADHQVTIGGFTLMRPEGRGYLGTIGVNHFVAQVMVLPPAEPVGTHPSEGQVVNLWPPSDVPLGWPPSRPLETAADLDAFGRVVAGVPVVDDSPPPQVPLS
jgi:hypothetical protein